MMYSRELRNLIYFEVYGFNPTMYSGKRYVACDGLVLSSFRPVEVLVPYKLHSYLREAVVKKYIALGSTSNKRVVISSSNIVACIYDRKKLKKLTGKEATIPKRIDMRVRTTKREDDKVLLVDWNEVPSYLYDSDKELILLALYYVRSSLGMKMFRLSKYREVEKIVRKLRYAEGLLIIHDEAYVFVPRSKSYIHYNDVRRAFISLKQPFTDSEFMSTYDLGEENLYEYLDEENKSLI